MNGDNIGKAAIRWVIALLIIGAVVFLYWLLGQYVPEVTP